MHYEVWSRYARGAVISVSSRHRSGVKRIGEEGWIWADRGSQEGSSMAWFSRDFGPRPRKACMSNDHVGNFLECVRSRNACIATAAIGYRSITPGHLGYVAEAVGRTLQWDPEMKVIVGDEEADNVLMTVDYRAPWSLEM